MISAPHEVCHSYHPTIDYLGQIVNKRSQQYGVLTAEEGAIKGEKRSQRQGRLKYAHGGIICYCRLQSRHRIGIPSLAGFDPKQSARDSNLKIAELRLSSCDEIDPTAGNIPHRHQTYIADAV